MTRAEAAGKLCEQLAGDVAAVVPVGLGRWPEVWEIVDGPSAEFMIALTAWESTGSEEDRGRGREWYRRLLAAWKEAARQYERETAR